MTNLLCCCIIIIEHKFYNFWEGCTILEEFINAIKSKNKQNVSSKKWKNWIAQIYDIKLCEDCRKQHGKIFPIDEILLPMHLYCRCVVEPLRAIVAGYVTSKGTAGADYWLKNYGKLPDDYITKTEAKKYGWQSQKGNLSIIAPGKTIGGDIYFNRDGHLPSSVGRIWYEADINYENGYRNPVRLVYSNDGLIFVTYDHYETFMEVI